MIPEVLPALSHVRGVKAFFTTRRGGISAGPYASLNLSYFTGDDPERIRGNWLRLLGSQSLSDRPLVLPKLCHGTGMVEVAGTAAVGAATRDAPTAAAMAPENTDAIFTRDAGWVLAVTMGDCLAALIADPETRCVAAVHAGWRGSRDDILGQSLRKLFSSGHCRPASTWIALGPCLSPGALEIPEELARTLPSAHVRSRGNRFEFDLRGCNRAQAAAAGAFPDRISDAEGCTRTEPDRFFSYRRDGAASGRMAAVIALIGRGDG